MPAVMSSRNTCPSSPVVTLTQTASVRGKYVHVLGKDSPVEAFLGIPYALPPVGERRFLAPKPVQLWEGERNCTEFGAICPQRISFYDLLSSNFIPDGTIDPPSTNISEDCLFLNVWTPSTGRTTSLPVMVWIHGGGFMMGSSNAYNLSAVSALNNVVCVSINYRLGICGFATTGDDVIPGNAGILDQIEALKWIQKYIPEFGGDPDNVTIIGHSAGGMSASLNLFSDLTSGLFHRIICMSGVCTSTYAVTTQRQQLENMRAGLKTLGYTGRNSRDILDFLRSKSHQELVDTFQFPFKVVIDGHYIKDFPENLHRRDRAQAIPVISGYVTHEAYFTKILTKRLELDAKLNANNIRDYVTNAIQYRYRHNVKKTTDALMTLYFPDDVLRNPETLMRILIDLYSDLTFVGPAHTFAKKSCGTSAHYLYEFAHRPSWSSALDWVTSTHADDQVLVSGSPFCDGSTFPFSDEEKRLSRLMMSYFTNFAKTGNPNGGDLPNWPQFTQDKREYFCLKPTPEVAANYSPEKMEFWDKTTRTLDNQILKSRI